jgi:hypothetical protein
MKIYKLFSAIVLLFYLVPCWAQQKINSKNSLKEEALIFSLKVVKFYFNGSCNDYYSCFNDTVYNFSNAIPIAVVEYKDKICESFKKAVREKKYSFERYKKEYQTEVVKKQKMLQKQPGIKLGNGFVPLDSDFIFLGGFPKVKSDNFPIWDDMFGFVVRKINGKWKIISLGS